MSLTSSGSSSDMRRTETLGASRYIRKPLMLEDFLREVGAGVEEMLSRKGLMADVRGPGKSSQQQQLG